MRRLPAVPARNTKIGLSHCPAGADFFGTVNTLANYRGVSFPRATPTWQDPTASARPRLGPFLLHFGARD